MMALHLTCKVRKLIVTLQCFIDESADGLSNHTVVMAGYVADDEIWAKFDADWRMELKNQKIDFAHFKSNIFKGRTATKNAEIFYRIIEKYLDKAICVTCNVSEYRSLMARCKFPVSLTESPKYALLNDPHMFLYRAFIDFCFDERKKLGIVDPVDLIFDQTNKYEGIVTGVFGYLYHSAQALGIDPKGFGQKPAFADDKTTPALQAADLLARLVRYNLVNGKPTTEMPWGKLKVMNHLVTAMGEKYILGILDSSFSQQNTEIYEKYAKTRHYRLYDFLNRFLKCLPPFIRKPIIRKLNKPLLLG